MTAPLDREVHISVFPDVFAKRCNSQFISLTAFAAQLRDTHAEHKNGLPRFSMCSYGRQRTAENSLRHDANVRECFAVVGDYDGEKTSLADAAEALRRAGISALLVTTPSYRPDAPRWRVIAPLSDPLNRARANGAGLALADHPTLVSRLAGIFPDGFGPESWALSQSWYLGSVNGAAHHGTLAIGDGAYIDLRPDLDATARPKPKSKPKRGQRRAPQDPGTGLPLLEPPDDDALPLDVAAALDAIAAGDGSHDAMVRLVGRWADYGLPRKDVEAAITSALLRRPAGQRDANWHRAMADVSRLVAWAHAKEAAAPPAPPPPPPPSGTATSGTGPSSGPDMDLDASLPPAYTDEALALAFAEQHAGRLRHVAAWGRWLIWDGKVWGTDETLRVYSLARLMLRQAAASCKKRRIAAHIASARTVAAVVNLARADRRLAATTEQWDHHSELLNHPDGVLDLRTDQLRPHRIDDYLTKTTAVAPGGDCPNWLAFLDRITAGDKDLQAFLQRMAGYCVTGSTVEQVLFFLQGPGGNGKGVFIGTLTSVLGSYAQTAAMGTFTAAPTEQHSCDLAMLRGARLVVMQETDDGKRWAEAKVKALTGGDTITARFMRQDFFSYTPTFKIIVASNHRPGLRNVNEAIRRRLLLVPFSVVIPAPDRDRYLARKLQKEWPGVLAWMIEGCREWQRIGLAPPAAVTAASAEYLANEDLIQSWIEECAELARDKAVYSSAAYSSFKAWMELAGEFVPSHRWFVMALVDRGFRQGRSNAKRHLIGLVLKSGAGTVPP